MQVCPHVWIWYLALRAAVVSSPDICGCFNIIIWVLNRTLCVFTSDQRIGNWINVSASWIYCCSTTQSLEENVGSFSFIRRSRIWFLVSRKALMLADICQRITAERKTASMPAGYECILCTAPSLVMRRLLKASLTYCETESRAYSIQCVLHDLSMIHVRRLQVQIHEVSSLHAWTWVLCQMFQTPPWECGVFSFHFHSILARLLRTNFNGYSHLGLLWP